MWFYKIRSCGDAFIFISVFICMPNNINLSECKFLDPVIFCFSELQP